MGARYNLELESRTERGKNVYEFVSADGTATTDSFRSSELLLLDSVEPDKDDDILVVESGIGVLGIVADQAFNRQTVLADTSARACDLAGKNVERNSIENAKVRNVAGLHQLDRNFDLVIYAPRPYVPVDVVRNNIIDAAELLNTNGDLYIAADKNSGINRYSQQLEELNGNTEKIGQRDGEKVYHFTKKGEVKTEKIDTSNSFTAEVLGIAAEFETVDGLFSPGKIDDGTRLLLESLDINEEDSVLDLGCGYGAIGVFLRKRYGCEIYLSDDSARATEYARKNLEANDIQDYRLETADCLEGFNQKFDVIVTNPPTHAGKGVIDEMLEQSYDHLGEDGQLYLVVNRGLGFRNKLENLFGNTEKLAEKDNYNVLKARKLS